MLVQRTIKAANSAANAPRAGQRQRGLKTAMTVAAAARQTADARTVRTTSLPGPANATRSAPQLPIASTDTPSAESPAALASLASGALIRIRTRRSAALLPGSRIGRRDAPERPRYLLQRTARVVGLELVADHRDDVRAHLGIGHEVAVAVEIRSPTDLDHVGLAPIPKLLDLLRSQHGRVDAPEPRDASEQPARRGERLVVGRSIDRDLELR